MADKVKSPIGILIVLIVISLFLAGGVFYLLQKEKAKTLILQAELQDLKTAQKITETKLAESKKLISGLEIKLQEAQAKIDKLTGDLEQEKTARQEATGQIEKLRAELEQQKKSRFDSESKLIQSQEDMKKIQAQLKVLDSRKAELETKIKDLENQVQQQGQGQGVELGTIVVNPEAGATGPAAGAKKSTGKILVVNKEYNFAVINLGSNDGINLGDTFTVYHGTEYIGDVRIDKVHEAMSAAGFVSAEVKNKVSEGDKVVLQTK